MQSVCFRFTVSYARFGDGLPAPDDINTAECDLCLNTIFVRPEAIKLFECENASDGKHSIFVTVLSTSDGGGNHTIMVLDDRSMGWNSVPVAVTPEGMMCKYKSHKLCSLHNHNQ